MKSDVNDLALCKRSLNNLEEQLLDCAGEKKGSYRKRKKTFKRSLTLLEVVHTNYLPELSKQTNIRWYISFICFLTRIDTGNPLFIEKPSHLRKKHKLKYK